MTVTETDVQLDSGHKVHVYDTGADAAGDQLVVFWHHGTPSLGSPPTPLALPGIRWVSYDRPGYGGSPTNAGRNVAHAARCVERIADALRIDKFAVMGHSGGGPHALACAALLPTRVIAVVAIATIAPYQVEGVEWNKETYYAGMLASGVASLQAATLGREEKKKHETSVAYEFEFTQADKNALAGKWGWLKEVSTESIDGLVDDDIAYVSQMKLTNRINYN